MVALSCIGVNCRKEEVKESDTWHQIEHHCSNFMHSFKLCENALLDRIKTEVNNWVHIVKLPKFWDGSKMDRDLQHWTRFEPQSYSLLHCKLIVEGGWFASQFSNSWAWRNLTWISHKVIDFKLHELNRRVCSFCCLRIVKSSTNNIIFLHHSPRTMQSSWTLSFVKFNFLLWFQPLWIKGSNCVWFIHSSHLVSNN